MYRHEMPTPIGPLRLVGTDQALTNIYFQSGPHPARATAAYVDSQGPFARVIRQLDEYFAGRRREFDLPLAPSGTAFQLAVWNALRGIAYGRTTSYGQLARDVGNSNGARAVGFASGSNPLPVVIPCHRVIGADGSLTGFGGGLDIKRALLRIEGASCVTDLFNMDAPPTGPASSPSR